MTNDNWIPVAATDRRAWSAAKCLQDVADLTAQWLEGTVGSQPNYMPNAGPDRETQSLIPTLAAANRAGFLTTSSQPGFSPRRGFGDHVWAQRAAVEGFVHGGPLLDELVTIGRDAGLIVLLELSPYFPAAQRFAQAGAMAVTTCDGEPVTAFGRHRHSSYQDDDLCPTAAADDIENAAHLTLIDPEFTAAESVWKVVRDAIEAAQARASISDETGQFHAGPVEQVQEQEPAEGMTLFAPRIRILSTNESQFDAMMTWRAEIEMDDLDDPGDPAPVVVGYVDFITVRLFEHEVPDLLDSLSAAAETYADLFDGAELSPDVLANFSDAPLINNVLIIETAVIGAPLRGQDLGAWAVSEIIARMADTTDTLVLIYPYPALAHTGDVDELAAVTALCRHWMQVGLEPIDGAPEFLGNTTAFTAIGEARARLRQVEDVKVHVPRTSLEPESEFAQWPRLVVEGLQQW